jgi:hypothetical protein
MQLFIIADLIIETTVNFKIVPMPFVLLLDRFTTGFISTSPQLREAENSTNNT